MVCRLIPFIVVLLGAGCEEQASDASREEAQGNADSVVVDRENAEEEEGPSGMKTEPAEDPKGSSPSSLSPDRTLTDAQKKRIGPRLQRVIRGEDPGMRPVESVGKRGTASIYEVIIRCNDAEALRGQECKLS